MELVMNSGFSSLSVEDMEMVTGGFNPFNCVDSFVKGFSGQTIEKHCEEFGRNVRKEGGWAVLDFVFPPTKAY